MSQWEILLTDGLEEGGQEILRREAVVMNAPKITAEELLLVVPHYDALIVRGRTKVTEEVLNAGSRLKVVGRAGVGVDNIDLAAAKQRGVIVVNAPTATTIAVAELTIGLMLSAARGIPRGNAGLKEGRWLKSEMQGTELWHKTLGIIGFGRIGVATAQRAKAFDMNVIAYDPILEELLAQSDIITIHVPLLDATRNMINAESFAQMKPGVILICAARGGIIDEAALLDALNSGKVKVAALDVFATEPPGLSDLVTNPGVICVPHIGAQTGEAQLRAAEDISTEVLAALNGKYLRWRLV